ncbi:hypothetical protein PHJA_000405000 [Phtheirospermum japonicum]|uniref:Uncharacterized protein n=1 Tax=Phtheirospermum japonicum TaxID=374723 RepID=A0A830BBM3_9LAMI|nr:hypothetical protein PHJA_000405000 [Phtheirospermum japonicum]
MSGYHPLMKKPKIEIDEEDPTEIEEEEEEDPEEESNDGEMEEQIRSEQEEALVALIEHRAKEVEHLRHRITYYKTQNKPVSKVHRLVTVVRLWERTRALDIMESAIGSPVLRSSHRSEKRLEDTQSKLARLRGWNGVKASKNSSNGREEAKVEKKSPSPLKMIESSSQKQSPYQRQDSLKPSVDNSNLTRKSNSSQTQIQPKPPLVITAVNPNLSQPIKTKEPGIKFSRGSGAPSTSSTPVNVKGEKSRKISSEQDAMESQSKGTKRKIGLFVFFALSFLHFNDFSFFLALQALVIEIGFTNQKEHIDLIQLIGKKSSSVPIRCHGGPLISSQHKRKLRSLALCPTNDQLFVTSALDGAVNLWEIQGRGADCQSDKQRRWPEDIAWHPHGNKLFSVYSADGGDSQISVLNLNKGREKTGVSFLEDKPHRKGIINSIEFMPWDDRSFVTGGSDHAVILWTEKEDDKWKPQTLHKNHHSSAVMGVAGMQHRNIVMSAGADKRIIGYDVTTGRADYKHQIDSKCMSVLPNPCDFNLFMVQTGTPERQLRLFDLRLRQMEIHAFGFKQESSESQSALINQAWSPDGLYMTSGSVDPIIHIFDIRYNAQKPSQSIKAHQKRVFKAAWHHALPLLISISSDLNIGLHRIN